MVLEVLAYARRQGKEMMLKDWKRRDKLAIVKKSKGICKLLVPIRERVRIGTKNQSPKMNRILFTNNTNLRNLIERIKRRRRMRGRRIGRHMREETKCISN